MTSAPMRVFDGHNDVLYRLYHGERDRAEALFFEGEDKGHIDFPRACQGGLAGGMFAIFPPALPVVQGEARKRLPGEEASLAPSLSMLDAQSPTFAMASLLLRLERASEGRFQVCRSAAEVVAAMDRAALAAVFHIEGVEAIDPDLELLDVLHAAGLRSIGIVWSRANAFGTGVPFRFPSSPDIGPGLTDAGKALVRACNRLKILIDTSHLNEQGFRDVASLSDAPLVATHSNVHDVCPHARNLTPWQLAAIRETGGMVGLNFAVSFLRSDGAMNTDTGLEVLIQHLDAMVEAVGEDCVGLGSDFDGAQIPKVIGDATGLPRLIDAMRDRGYGPELIEKIAWRNWVSLLERTIG